MLSVQPGGDMGGGKGAGGASVNGGEEKGDETVQMFFRMFDIDNSGVINRDEFNLALEHLSTFMPHALHIEEGEDPRATNEAFHASVDELFREMDVSGDGTIQYEEFKKFYDEVMRATSQTSVAVMQSIAS
jgi:Ca2+-binding EF-hand superfamily protein